MFVLKGKDQRWVSHLFLLSRARGLCPVLQPQTLQCFTIQLGTANIHAHQHQGLTGSGGMRASHPHGSELRPELQMGSFKLAVAPTSPAWQGRGEDKTKPQVNWPGMKLSSCPDSRQTDLFGMSVRSRASG